MRQPNWNDLRHLLATARAGSLAGAARDLGVDDTTVARRLRALEAALGATLLERRADGRLHPSEAGRRALAGAERVERELEALRRGGADRGAGLGVVRLTAVPLLVDRLLVPALPRLFASHPGLALELIAEPADLSLTRRQADMALRLARPRVGGGRVLARRIGQLRYGVYAAAEAQDAPPWLSYDEAWAHLPQALWVAERLARGEGERAPLAVSDGEALLEAAAAGLGRALLPCLVAGRDGRLRRLPEPPDAPPPVREAWLLVHAELHDLPRIGAVSDWLAALLEEPA